MKTTWSLKLQMEKSGNTLDKKKAPNWVPTLSLLGNLTQDIFNCLVSCTASASFIL